MKARNYAPSRTASRNRCHFARAMKKRGATQVQIAALLNVERTTVTYYLSARCKW